MKREKGEDGLLDPRGFNGTAEADGPLGRKGQPGPPGMKGLCVVHVK